ncbi:YbaB/EbfC family nucleoid-associated protein [Amycolatopsis thailandensis]|uniref:YbaB/EbfC family nucleoid-associated protein n=1 Tax=Amycolatopsis thailandensis TaxID=589330 RepID=UPI00363D49D0
MAALERERKKVGKLSELWNEGGMTVRAKDNSLSMTFDGRGELTELVFNESKYRSLAPAQLANVILETLQRGKAESMAKMSELMGTGSVSGLDLGEVAAGKIDPQQMIEALISPLLGAAEGLGGDFDWEKKTKLAEEREGNG